MGFFSWVTSDTKESIPSWHSGQACKTTYLLMPDGNNLVFDGYEGYGVMAGVDVYELLAQRNGLGDSRDAGIDLYYSDDYKSAEFQLKFVHDGSLNYADVKASEDCPHQGFFYPE